MGSSTHHSGGVPHPLCSNEDPNSHDLGTAEYEEEAPPLTPGVLSTPSVLQDVAVRSKMWLQEPRCGCRNQNVAAEDKIWLQEPSCGCRSQDVTAGVKMWLHYPKCCCRSQDGAAGAKILLQEPWFCCGIQHLATKAKIWLSEWRFGWWSKFLFYIIALEGRVHSQFTGQALTQGVSSRELHSDLRDLNGSRVWRNSVR